MTSRISRWRPLAAAGAIAVAVAVGLGASAAWPAGTSAASPAAARAAGPKATLASLKLPARATIKPDIKAPAMTSTCPTVRAHLAEYRARHIKIVQCTTVGASPASAQVPARPATLGTSPGVNPLCGNVFNKWMINRTTECIQGLSVSDQYINVNCLTSCPPLGEAFFSVNVSITAGTNNDEVSEVDAVTFLRGTGMDDAPGKITIDAFCSSDCRVLSGSQSFTLAPSQVENQVDFTYIDTPAAGNLDYFLTSYEFGFVTAASFQITQATWVTPNDVRCDNQLSPRGIGCVFPEYTPTLVLSAATYGAAAINVLVGEKYLAGNPGTSLDPLTRGDPSLTQGNRSAVCDSSFYANFALVQMDSCDEYPFASSQQSGGQRGLTGKQCLETEPQYFGAGAWDVQFYSLDTGGMLCERGHVNGPLNSAVGTALGAMYTTQRMLAGDPYTVVVTS